MPRRNVWLLVALTLICLPCHLRNNRYGHILGYALAEIDRRALNQTKPEDLFEGAVSGMMNELNDPHSVFISAADFAKFRQALDQEFGGVGIEIVLDPDTKQLTVASPLYGTPAFAAGIRPRDRILRIDGKTTQGMSLEDASSVLKGKLGTPVALLIQHDGEEQPVEIRIVRAKIQVDSVLGDVRKPDGTWEYFLEGRDRIAYLRINQFGERTVEEMQKAMRALGEGGVRGLVLDLRNDPGGLLPAAVEICDMFIDSGVIVTTRRRDGVVRDVVMARKKQDCPRYPVAVLVDRYTASAAEIVAACLQDHGRAVVVGERTFGKGTVQELISLPGRQGTLKLTTASYWRPSGKNINRRDKAGDDEEWGVRPDPGYEVKIEGEQLSRLVRWHREVGIYRSSGSRRPAAAQGNGKPMLPTDVDPQLSKAVEYVEAKAAAK